MGFSAISRRWIARSESLRRIYVADVVSPGANRKMSTGGVTWAAAPLLMLPPAVDGRGNIAYTFHRLANNAKITRENKIGGGGGPDELRLPSDLIKDVKFVGSTHGWLALYNRRNRDLFLSNPITQRHIKLPPPPPLLRTVDRLVLSEEDITCCLAFKSGVEGRLAFCSPRRSNEWTVFGNEYQAYDNLVYSSRHHRLFCVAFNNSSNYDFDSYKEGTDQIFDWENYMAGTVPILESWDVEGTVPRLDWTIDPGPDVIVNTSFYANGNRYNWPYPMHIKNLCSQVTYLVCAEHSGDLFLVVRYVNLRAGPGCSIVNKLVYSEYNGCDYMRIPYRTVDFDVYKVDLETRRLILMKDSLEGLAIFVGINNPLAIAATDDAGVKPDCVYFTDENRLVESTRLERTNYGGHDNGIFDYRNKEISPCCELYPVEYDQIRKILPLPLWFVPTTTHY